MSLFSRDSVIIGLVDEAHVPKKHKWKRVASRGGGQVCIDCRLYVTERMMRRLRLPPCVVIGTFQVLNDAGEELGSV